MKDESPYTKVPNCIFDIEGLNVYERIILLYVIRRTIGFNKNSDGISLSQFTKYTGLSKPTILKAIDKLKDLRLLKVSKQTNITGGKHYNRYTPLVNEIYKGSKGDLQGLVKEVYIQKENIIKRERENIFFNFYSEVENKKLFTKKFIDELISIENVRNPVSYRSTIEKKLSSRNKETLINFDKWYLNDYTEQLNRTYKSYFINDKEIMKIDNYFNFTSERKEMLGLVLKNKNNKAEVIYFDTKKEIEEYLKEAINETIWTPGRSN